jgi:hypothetical protein
MKETGIRSSLFGVLAFFAAAPAFAQPPGASPGKAEAKAEKATEKAEVKAAKADDKAVAKAAKADDKAQKPEAKEGKAEGKSDKAEGRGPHDHDHHGGPGAGPSGAPSGARPPHAHAHRGFRGLGFEFSHGKMTKPELEKRIAEMRANKVERRKEHREGLRHRWGVALMHPAVREELRHHARREAFLSRALFLAQTQAAPKDKDKLIARIEKLIEKEDARHDRAMERLKSMPPPPASAASAAAAPGASAAAAAPAAAPSAAPSAKGGAQ